MFVTTVGVILLLHPSSAQRQLGTVDFVEGGGSDDRNKRRQGGVNHELLPRITERLNDFFKIPVESVQRYVNYHKRGAISSTNMMIDNDNDTTITSGTTTIGKKMSRNMIVKDLYAQALAAEESGYSTTMTIALDDGMYIGLASASELNQLSCQYREPGNAGYNTQDIDVDDPNYKYWNSCFNNSDGTSQQCRIDNTDSVLDQYIECINNCELVPCPSTFADSTGSNNTATTTTDENTVWCRNYVTKEIQKEEQKGYIPLYEMCINRKGEPENRPGFVVKNLKTKALGNCQYLYSAINPETTTYQILNISGNYYACDESKKSTTTSTITCSDAFTGAYFQLLYDHRYRPWYMLIKHILRPTWTEPFINPSTFYLSIGFYHPLFRVVTKKKQQSLTQSVSGNNTISNNNNNNGIGPSTDTNLHDRKVFDGVTSVDYKLSYFTEFLRSEFLNTKFRVLVVEQTSPHYIIATSYHDIQSQLKAVLRSNETIPCPDPKLQELINDGTDKDLAYGLGFWFNQTQHPCTIVRVPISDMNNDNNEQNDINHHSFLDRISYKAFIEHQKQNFPSSDTIVHVKSSNDIGSQVFVSQGTLFQLPLSLTPTPTTTAESSSSSSFSSSSSSYWHVIIIYPMDRSTNDVIVPGTVEFFALCFLTCFGSIGCMILFYLYTFHNNQHQHPRQQQQQQQQIVRTNNTPLVVSSDVVTSGSSIVRIGEEGAAITPTTTTRYNPDWFYTSTFLLGCTMLNLSSFTLIGENTNPMCMIRMWSFHGLVACTLSPLLANVYLMMTILQNKQATTGSRNNHTTKNGTKTSSNRNQSSSSSAILLLYYALPIIVIEVFILMIFSIVDPPRQTEQLGVVGSNSSGGDDNDDNANTNNSIGVQQITCEHETNGFFITQLVWNGLICLIGCIVTYKVARTKQNVLVDNNANVIGFVLYNIILTGCVTISATKVIDLDPASQKVVQVIGIVWATLVSCCLFVLPHYLFAVPTTVTNMERPNNEPSHHNSSSTNSTKKRNNNNNYHHHHHPHRCEEQQPVLSSSVSDLLSLNESITLVPPTTNTTSTTIATVGETSTTTTTTNLSPISERTTNNTSNNRYYSMSIPDGSTNNVQSLVAISEESET